jgi:hypothetical protein
VALAEGPEEPPPRLRESYNVAPTDVMPIIRPAGNVRNNGPELMEPVA